MIRYGEGTKTQVFNSLPSILLGGGWGERECVCVCACVCTLEETNKPTMNTHSLVLKKKLLTCGHGHDV